MKKLISFCTIILLHFCLLFNSASAHPASGIVVDKYGNVYFIYHGVVKVSTTGQITYIHKATDGHWICLDEHGIFSQTSPKYFERITPSGVTPAIIFAGGGSPMVMSNDGNFYYCGGQNGDMNPGAKSIVQETPGGQQKVFAPLLQKVLNELDDGITALATTPDGTLYIAGWNSLLKVAKDGKITTLIHPFAVSDCDEDPADHKVENKGKPLLRGIDIDSAGAVYLAATSCHCVLKITDDGKTKIVLKAQRPWSPTGLAVRNGNIYVLEYTNANGPRTEGWLPRVRKIDRDGKVSIIADLSSNN